MKPLTEEQIEKLVDRYFALPEHLILPVIHDRFIDRLRGEPRREFEEKASRVRNTNVRPIVLEILEAIGPAELWRIVDAALSRGLSELQATNSISNMFKADLLKKNRLAGMCECGKKRTSTWEITNA